MSFASPAQTVLLGSADSHNSSWSLTAQSHHKSHKQSFCRNVEGWGPLSPDRAFFTPCFLDASLAIFALAGVLLGLAAIFTLARTKGHKPWMKSWNFLAKLVSSL